MHLAVANQWLVGLFMIVSLTTVCYQEVSAGLSRARVTRSPVESLRDHGTYIVHFKEHIPEDELQNFITALVRKTNTERNFTAEIIEELFIIKCLTARLSRRALNWVRTVCIS